MTYHRKKIHGPRIVAKKPVFEPGGKTSGQCRMVLRTHDCLGGGVGAGPQPSAFFTKKFGRQLTRVVGQAKKVVISRSLHLNRRRQSAPSPTSKSSRFVKEPACTITTIQEFVNHEPGMPNSVFTRTPPRPKLYKASAIKRFCRKKVHLRPGEIFWALPSNTCFTGRGAFGGSRPPAVGPKTPTPPSPSARGEKNLAQKFRQP